MGIKVHKDYARDFIPFGRVMRKNFWLQEKVDKLSWDLKVAQNTVLQYERKMEYMIKDSNKRIREMNRIVDEAKEGVKLNKDRVDTFEGIIETMGIEKRKTQTLCQENVRLTVQLKELENENIVIKALVKKHNRINNESCSKQIDDKVSDDKVFGDKGSNIHSELEGENYKNSMNIVCNSLAK